MTYYDPVCEMKVETPSKFYSYFNGQRYEFCSEACKKQFDEAPQYYSTKKPTFANTNRTGSAGK